MSRLRATVRLAMLTPLVIGAGCSSPGSQPCTWCDAGKSDRPSEHASDAPAPEMTLITDAESEAVAIDRAIPTDEEDQIDWAEQSTLDGSRTDEADVPWGEVPGPSPVPDAGYLLFSDFEDGKAAGWRSADWNDAGMPDNDWSVILGDTGSVYCEGVLDKVEWHISYANLAPVPDQIVEARMRVGDFYDTTPSYIAALFARFDPISDSGYFVALRGDGSVIIRKRVQGKSASWASGVDAGIVPGAWHIVRLEVLDNTANAFLDGKLVYSVVDPDPLAAGTMALGSYGATLEVDRVFLARP